MRLGKKKKMVVAAALFFLTWMSAGQEIKTMSTPFGTAVKLDLARALEEAVHSLFLPGAAQLGEGEREEWLMIRQAEGILPLYGMARREAADRLPFAEEDDSTVLEYEELERKARPQPEQNGGEKKLQTLMEEENEAVMQEEREAARQMAEAEFTPHEKQMQVDLAELEDYEMLTRTFYTIDANTMAGSDQLNVDSLLARDLTLQRRQDGPVILIYHTHSQEGFVDSVPRDKDTTIVGVGEHLADILRTQYGYNVLHHMGQYDVETRDNAYGNALPELERILAENPSIEVVIDLHRDQMPEDTKLVLDLDGKPTARFMFFNGLSRTRKTGDIAYLRNENIADNLAFSFQLELKAMEYYPGLTRKIYLKGYRYNMHLRPRSLLIELGAQNNTVEEAMNACAPLAHLLDMVLTEKH